MREADLSGPRARAWITPKAPDTEPTSKTFLAGWLIHYPGVHAIWDWWGWSLVTLEDTEGIPPAKLQYPEARYELVGLALNPEHTPPDVDLYGPHSYLTPADLVKQFHVPTDSDAIAMIARAIETMVEGSAAPPDSDFSTWWSESIDITAAHVRAGKHPLN